MLKNSYYNKNILLSIILIMVFIVSIGAILPVTNGNTSPHTGIISSNLSRNEPKNVNQQTTTKNSITSNSVNNAASPTIQSTNNLQSLSSISSIPNPVTTNTTFYDNGTNFNTASASLLPFAERYRINSTLNGWVYNNGLTPDYIPLKPFNYSVYGIASGSTVYSYNFANFPALKFIPGFPVNITIKATDINFIVTVLNSTNQQVNNGYSSYNGFWQNITIIPTSTDTLHLKIYNQASTLPANITITIQQFANPAFFYPIMGDFNTSISTYYWYFSSAITSIGIATPPSLDLGALNYNRSDTANIDYSVGSTSYNTFGKGSVADNSSWTTPVSSFFNLTSQTGCLNQNCQSFLPMFFYDSNSTAPLSTGLWIPSLEVNHTFGANPQIIRFLSYFGQNNAPITPNQILVLDASGKMVLNLTSSFSSTPLALKTFANQLTVWLPTTTLVNGSYTLAIYGNSQSLYNYSFIVKDSLYGNYHAPVVNFGYEPVTYTNGTSRETIVYANVTDIDTSVDKVMLRYSLDNISWSSASAMQWVDVNKYAFAIPYNISQIANVSLSVFESAKSDQNQLRLQTITQFSSSVDLSVSTSTTMQVTLIPRGKSTTSPTQIKFLNDNSYQLVGLGVTLTNTGGYYVYTISNNVTVNTKQTASFTITPKNSGLLTINITSSSTGDTESVNSYFNVAGSSPVKLELSIINLPNQNVNLYPYLNNTYPVTVKYRFIGGTPTSNYTIVVSGSGGSMTTTSLSVSTQTTYPLVYYQKTVNANVTKTFTGTTTTITASIIYGANSNSTTKTISSYKPVVNGVLNDPNGFKLKTVYNNMIPNLNLIFELQYFNGTPMNNVSVKISSTFSYFTTKSFIIDAKNLHGNNFNTSVTLTQDPNFTGSTDDIIMDITWDGNSVQVVQIVSVNTFSIFSTAFNLGFSNTQLLDVTGNSYTINGTIKSLMSIPIRNVNLTLSYTYNITVVPKSIIIPLINPGEVVEFSFVINYGSNSQINVNALSFSLVMNSPGYSTYKSSFTIPTNSQTNSSNTENTTSNKKSTPGFEFYLILLVMLPLIYKRKKNNKN